MTLHPPLYILKIEDREPVLQPVLFKTVRCGKEHFLWPMRKTVLYLKLLDVVIYQREYWRGITNRFRLGCHDIVPPCELEDDLLQYFGLKDKVEQFTIEPWKQAVFCYDLYLKKLDDADAEQNEEVVEDCSKHDQIEDTPKIKSCQDSEETVMISNRSGSHIETSVATAKLTRTHTAQMTGESSEDTIRETITLLSQYADYKPCDFSIENKFWNLISEKLAVLDFATVNTQVQKLDILSSEHKKVILEKLYEVSRNLIKSIELDDNDQKMTSDIDHIAQLIKDKPGQLSTDVSCSGTSRSTVTTLL